MTFLKTLLFISLVLTFSSCAKQDYHVFGNTNLPEKEELTGFAFATDGLKKEWDINQEVIYKEMQRRNYFYDNVNPEVLVFVQEFPKDVSFLTGNKYLGGSGHQYFEPTKVKTKNNTIFIQLVETQKHQTIWRGFSYTSSRAFNPASNPILTRSVLNQ